MIEVAAPYLVQHHPQIDLVVLACGEPPERTWLAKFRASLTNVPVRCAVDPALRYLSEQSAQAETVKCRVQRFFTNLFRGTSATECVVWAHNQGLGRNPFLSHALARLAAAGRIRLVQHHHDWWFDNRWQRWPEMRQAGFITLRQVAEALLPAAPTVHHIAINRADATVLARYFPAQTAWLPNPVQPSNPPSAQAVRAAQRWLHDKIGANAPVWLMPCRLLRRKNIAEALLLTRWLRPEAWLVTTGGVSSEDELVYATRLNAAARQFGWRLRLGVLGKAKKSNPPMPTLLAASEVVLLTSLQEGFGLPFLEAVAAGRPLIARAISNIVPDLVMFGFRFPYMYEELLIDPALFNWQAELARQNRLFRAWRAQLPRPWRKFVGTPAILAAGTRPRPIPFSRLTLTAQLEVLAQPLHDSWRKCAELNPFLKRWRTLAETGNLCAANWPHRANKWLSGTAYAKKFSEVIFQRLRKSARANAPYDAQAELARLKLRAENLYPLTWNAHT